MNIIFRKFLIKCYSAIAISNSLMLNIYIYIVKKFGKGILISFFYHVSFGSRLSEMKNRMDEI